jgi:phospholipid transport system substrate-binding protein
MFSLLNPDVFVQSTVNRASQAFIKEYLKRRKNECIKEYCQGNCRYKRNWFYSLGSARKNLNDNQKKILF